MNRNEILEKITMLKIERDEVSGNYASHSLDLSNEFECMRTRSSKEIRKLEKMLTLRRS